MTGAENLCLVLRMNSMKGKVRTDIDKGIEDVGQGIDKEVKKVQKKLK